jgi:hypothetical protein
MRARRSRKIADHAEALVFAGLVAQTCLWAPPLALALTATRWLALILNRAGARLRRSLRRASLDVGIGLAMSLCVAAAFSAAAGVAAFAAWRFGAEALWLWRKERRMASLVHTILPAGFALACLLQAAPTIVFALGVASLLTIGDWIIRQLAAWRLSAPQPLQAIRMGAYFGMCALVALVSAEALSAIIVLLAYRAAICAPASAFGASAPTRHAAR